jgi:hypothetical protein
MSLNRKALSAIVLGLISVSALSIGAKAGGIFYHFPITAPIAPNTGLTGAPYWNDQYFPVCYYNTNAWWGPQGCTANCSNTLHNNWGQYLPANSQGVYYNSTQLVVACCPVGFHFDGLNVSPGCCVRN